MNSTVEHVADEKELLLARSALCRARLHCETRALAASLQWTHVAAEAAGSPPIRRLALGLAFSAVGIGRIARLVAFAGRALLYAKLVRSAIGYARSMRSK
jgi:hypothetical protein